MSHTQNALLASSLAALPSAQAASGSASASANSTAPPHVIANDPITEIRLLASLPVNLGQNLDKSV